MTVQSAVKRIIGSKFNRIFRCLDMLMLNLGNDINDLNNRSVPEYSFHVQTQWRFIKENKILLASRDIYLPYNPQINEREWEYDIGGRADNESSIFDVIQKTFSDNFTDAVVSDVEINLLGDLKIIFSNGIIFETFTPSMREDEFYCFICFDKNGDNEYFSVLE